MPVLRVNGVDLAFEEHGVDGPPLVLTHGSWGDRRGWAAVVPGLARVFRVVTWDRRGHGESGDMAGEGTREQDSEDLAGLIEGLGIAPAHVAGNSFGGSISLGLAARRPELFRSISVHEPPVFDVLAETGSTELDIARERIRRVTERLAAGDMEGGAALFADTVVGQAGSWDGFSAEARASMVRHAATFLDENRDPAVFALDLECLSGFARPALLSYGDGSPTYFEEVVRRVAEVVPNGRVHTFAGAGHVPHRSHPAAFVDELTAFVRSVE
ncbi:MAG TPA: alpha/beta hydrolase [Thermomicrobiales bacterium]|nr:alpha/beta hydrolase [Thermomicrobiales bacterium]